jgi:PAS domain S-box-containing protein
LSISLAVLAISIVSAIYLYQLHQFRSQQRFRAACDIAVNSIRVRIASYTTLLRSMGALALTGDQVTQTELELFARRTNLTENFPGVQGVGFAYHVPPESRAAFIAKMRIQFPGYTIWPVGERAQYFPISFLYPLDERNSVAIGFDMFSEPKRSVAIQRAWASGEPTASGKVRLVQEIDEDVQAGFLIYVPVYKTIDVPQTQSERIHALLGLAYSPFRADDLFKGMFGETSDLNLRIYDDLRLDDNLLHDSSRFEQATAAHEPEFAHSREFYVAGRKWILDFTSRPAFEITTESWAHLWVLVSGTLVAIALAAGLWSRGRASEGIEQQKEWLRVTLSSIGDAVIATDASGNVAFLNPVAESLTGWTASEADKKPLDQVFAVCDEENGQAILEKPTPASEPGTLVTARSAVLRLRHGEKHPFSTAPRRL